MTQRDLLDAKRARAVEILTEMRRVLIAFSGGVDSSVLLKLAVDTLGRDNVLAATAVGPLHPVWEQKRAEQIARAIGVQQVFIEDPACRQPEFMKNTPQRCYHCKKALLEQMKMIGEEYRIKHIIAGENADDQFDYRPGCRAMLELGVRCPLKEAHLAKAEIRALARQWGLPNAESPASPCLVTRIPYGHPITTELLGQIEQAEAYLHKLGFEVVRVRVHGPIARIEASPEDIPRLLQAELRGEVLAKFKDLGFAYTSVDLEGYQTGSLNKLIEVDAGI